MAKGVVYLNEAMSHPRLTGHRRTLIKHGSLKEEILSHTYSCLKNLMESMKKQKDMTLEDETPRSEGVQILLGKIEGQLQTTLEIMKWLGKSRKKNSQLCICLVIKVKTYA